MGSAMQVEHVAGVGDDAEFKVSPDPSGHPADRGVGVDFP
jgi:hypothetical protein